MITSIRPCVALQGTARRRSLISAPRISHRIGQAARSMPGGENPVPDDLSNGSYGSKFKEDARRYYGAVVGFYARGAR